MKAIHRIFCRLLQTGQTTSYETDDDGDLEKGVPHDYTILTAGDHAGTTNITINGKTHALSNNCVWDNRTGLMWARYAPNADIGPATDGRLFWEQWDLVDKTDISFDNASGEIRSGAAEFNTDALCAGRKLTVSGSVSNDGTYTVSAIAAGAITTVEGVADEAAGATITIATVDDLIWDACDQANANSLGGYTDWRIPNYHELASIVNIDNCSPTIDTTTFPSTSSSYYWTSSTRPCYSPNAWCVNFYNGYVGSYNKRTNKCYVRLVRGGY